MRTMSAGAMALVISIIACMVMAQPAEAQQRRSRSRAKTAAAAPKRVATGPDRKIAGALVDSESGETLPFSNVFVRGTLIGTLTDMDGRFALTVPARYDTIRFGAMGYREQWMLTEIAAKSDSLVVKMVPDNIAIGEVEVHPDDAPTRLIKSVIANKRRNDPNGHRRAEYEKYTSWQYSLANISDRVADKGVLLSGAKDLMVMNEDSTRILPVYFSETLSKNELQTSPRKARTTIIADRTRGIDIFKQYEVGGFSNALDNEINFYEDFVKMMGVGFVSPIADDGLHYYDYFIVDSAMVAAAPGQSSYVGLMGDSIRADSTRVYTVKFRPHNIGDRAFVGTMDIETRRYSPTRIDAEMPDWTNINFVKRLNISSTFQMVNDTTPFFGTNAMDLLVDYMPTNSDKKRLSIHCQMFNSQSKVRLDMQDTLSLSKRALSVETLKDADYKERDDAFWEERRHGEMSEETRQANATMDSLNNVPSVKFFNYVAKAFITSYLDIGHVEIGPIGQMFNTNKVEGVHIGFGLRTSKEISENWVVNGMAGYGFRNERLSYEAGLGYRFNGAMRRTLELSYSDRIMKIGEDENILYLYENMLTTSETNIVAQLFKREEIDELLYCQKISLRYDNEWFTGVKSRLQLTALRQESPIYYPFTQDGQPVPSVKKVEASLDFRFSWLEKFMDDGLQRMYLSTDWPIVHITVAGGATEAGEKSSRYMRLHSTLKQRFYFGQTQLNLAVENGIYFGKLPYSVLNIARGNKTYGFYRYDFNLMDYLEFVCDRYLYVHADYHLEGLLLHKLPAVHKLGLREVVGLKLMVGGLGERHTAMLDLPDGVGGPTRPYAEVNFGIDNVFRFFRFDFVWRPIGESHVGAPKMGLRAQFSVKI